MSFWSPDCPWNYVKIREAGEVGNPSGSIYDGRSRLPSMTNDPRAQVAYFPHPKSLLISNLTDIITQCGWRLGEEKMAGSAPLSHLGSQDPSTWVSAIPFKAQFFTIRCFPPLREERPQEEGNPALTPWLIPHFLPYSIGKN